MKVFVYYYDAQSDRANENSRGACSRRTRKRKATERMKFARCIFTQGENVEVKKRYAEGGNMREDVTLRLATQEDAELIHQMKYEAFLPLYEKYQDDETSPAKEGIEKVIRQLQEERTDYYYCSNNIRRQ